MNKNGFTLIEFIAYVGLFAFIALIFFGITSKVQLKFVTNSDAQEVLLRQSIAFDLLRRDLMSASPFASDWDFKDFVFKKLTLSDRNMKQSTCVCWMIGAQGLVRIEGDYDFQEHEWTKKYTSLVCKTVKQIDFVLQKHEGDGILSGVWVTCAGLNSQQAQNTFEQKFFVKFRNRILTCRILT